jgi:hypothetical protein
MSAASHAHDHGAARQDQPAAAHTMVLFGDKTLYLSHMPNYPPHNEQVVVTVSLSKTAGSPRTTAIRPRDRPLNVRNVIPDTENTGTPE